MNFVDAKKALKEGKRVKRKGWETALAMTESTYSYTIGDWIAPFIVKLSTDIGIGETSTVYYASSLDIVATDWEVVEDD
jgi:Protein of unknown function (DUF2829).